MVTGRNVTVLSSKFSSTKTLKEFLEKTTGAKLSPVKGREDTYWISGDKRGDYYQQKYYKVEFGHVDQVSYSHDNKYGQPAKKVRSGYGFDIQAPGDYNSWSMMGKYREMIHESLQKFKKENA